MHLRGTTRLLGILGNPLSHSFSPAMHNSGIESLGLDLVYLPLQIPNESLETCLRAMQALPFLGANVTMPHKRAIIPFLDEVSEISKTIGAVNTLIFKDGKISGTTTDPDGFLAGFAEAGHNFDGKSVAVLGNGSTARTIVFSLFLKSRPKSVVLVARDPSKSNAIISEIQSKLNRDLQQIDFADYPARRTEFDILVQTTPVGMHPDTEQSLIPAEYLEPGQIIYDILYNPEETALMRHARTRGCSIVGGLGMLVHQGLASFRLWTGANPAPAAFYAGIRRQQALDAAHSKTLVRPA